MKQRHNLHADLAKLGYAMFGAFDLSAEMWLHLDPKDPDQQPFTQTSVSLSAMIGNLSLHAAMKIFPDLLDRQDLADDQEDDKFGPYEAPLYLDLLVEHLSETAADKTLLVLVDSDLYFSEEIEIADLVNHAATQFILCASATEGLRRFISEQAVNLQHYRQMMVAAPISALRH